MGWQGEDAGHRGEHDSEPRELGHRGLGWVFEAVDVVDVARLPGDLGDAEWWWFNVRSSNTEPFLRLNLEASSAELRDRRRDELVSILGESE